LAKTDVLVDYFKINFDHTQNVDSCGPWRVAKGQNTKRVQVRMPLKESSKQWFKPSTT